jgi:hypothetical protein
MDPNQHFIGTWYWFDDLAEFQIINRPVPGLDNRLDPLAHDWMERTHSFRHEGSPGTNGAQFRQVPASNTDAAPSSGTGR